MENFNRLVLKFLLTVILVISMVSNAQAQSNNRSPSHLNVPNLDHIFKNYEGKPKKFVPKLQKYKRQPAARRVETTNSKDNNKNLTFDTFLEVREFTKSKVAMKSLPNKNGILLHTLGSGDMIKVKFTLQDFIRQQHAEQKNLGYWRKAKAQAVVGERDFYFYSHWKQMQVLNPYEAVQLNILVPQNQTSVPVFSKPGYVDWRECSQIYELCNAFIDTYSDVELVDAKVFEVDGLYSRTRKWELFYKVKFTYLKSDGRSATGRGWIPSKYAKRKLKPLSLSMYNLSKNRDLASLGGKGSKKFFVFDNNEKNPHISASRWLSATSASQLKYRTGLFDKSYALDVVLGLNYTTLDQEFLDEGEGLEQYGVNVGMGISAPLFLDVDVEGMVTVTVPVSASTKKKSSFIYFDEWFNLTLPKAWLDAPLKFGLGGYYYLMTNNNDQFGFNRLIGFQARIKWEMQKYHLFAKFSPIGIDLDSEFTDREIAFGVGYRFKPSRGYESPHINLDIADVNYEPNEPGESPRTLKIQKFNLNLVYPF